MNHNIPNPPYFSGPGWSDKTDAWIEANIPAEWRGAVRSEAMISWNLRGGAPSGHWAYVLSRTVTALNAGETPLFPNIEFNDRYLAEQRARRERGLDQTPDLESIR